MDLGTNTFHLLIVDGEHDHFNILAHETIATKLGEGGINKGVIVPQAFERGIKAMEHFAGLIEQHKATKVKAIATSAMRNAANGGEFIKETKRLTNIDIETINGDREAELIYKGIRAAGVLTSQNTLILDIGGGSVEFILGNNEEVVFKQSVEIGAARLTELYHKSDPIPSVYIAALRNHLDEALSGVVTAVKAYGVNVLTGSSGSFETFAALAEQRHGRDIDLKSIKHYAFDTEEFMDLTDELIASTHEERAANPAIVPVRVDMIVSASMITRYVMRSLGITRVDMSTYSLKEGIVAELLD